MSVEINSLTLGDPVIDNSLPAPNDFFNVIPNANTVYDLYTVPNTKTALVENIRLWNTHAATVQVTLYFNRPNADGKHRRRPITPVGMPLPANFGYVDDHEITLGPGDKIQAMANVSNVIQYLISGVEREVV